MFECLRAAGFDVATRNHADAILTVNFSAELRELVTALESFAIPATELIGSGGGEAPATQRLRRNLSEAGWMKHNFVVEVSVDGEMREATGHEIDHVRRCSSGTIALEIEWNNKDPFFDRDLENFQRLHAQSVISVGIIVTRGAAMQARMTGIIEGFQRSRGHEDATSLMAYGMKRRTDRQTAAVDRLIKRGVDFPAAFARTFVADKFGEATTHWRKLEDRIARGVGNPCPLLLLGLPDGAVMPDR